MKWIYDWQSFRQCGRTTLVAYSALHFHKRLSSPSLSSLVCCLHFVCNQKCICCLYKYWKMKWLFSKVMGSMVLSRSFSHQVFQQRFILLSLDIFCAFYKRRQHYVHDGSFWKKILSSSYPMDTVRCDWKNIKSCSKKIFHSVHKLDDKQFCFWISHIWNNNPTSLLSTFHL